MVSLDEGWASLSLDFKDATASLIHPTVTMQTNIGWMKTLTDAAQATLKNLGGVDPSKPWQYEVALKGGVPIDRYESTPTLPKLALTAYYFNLL